MLAQSCSARSQTISPARCIFSSSAGDLQTIILPVPRAAKISAAHRRHLLHARRRRPPSASTPCAAGNNPPAAWSARSYAASRSRITSSAIIGALHQLAAVVVATSGHLRRAVINVVNLAAHPAGPPAGQPAQQLVRVHREVHHQRLRRTRCAAESRPALRPAAACAEIRRSINPLAQSGRAIRSSTIPSTISSGTSSPRSMIGLACRPSVVCREPCGRETCRRSKGAARRTARRPLGLRSLAGARRAQKNHCAPACSRALPLPDQA